MSVILDLCGGTGSWSQPYRDAGYDVLTIDLGDAATPAVEQDYPGLIREDVRLWQPPRGLKVHGILAAPPCTAFSVSGARWWAGKGEAGLLEALSIADACRRLIGVLEPSWWALENPIGRMRHWHGAPAHIFQPWQYGDPWQKATCLWGKFRMPTPLHVVKPEGTDTRIHRAPPGPDRARFRSMTPPGFARAFYEANP